MGGSEKKPKLGREGRDVQIHVWPTPDSILRPPVPATNIRIISGTAGHILYFFSVQQDLNDHPAIRAEVEAAIEQVGPESSGPVDAKISLPSVGKFLMTTEALRSLVGVLSGHLENMSRYEAEMGKS